MPRHDHEDLPSRLRQQVSGARQLQGASKALRVGFQDLPPPRSRVVAAARPTGTRYSHCIYTSSLYMRPGRFCSMLHGGRVVPYSLRLLP